MADKLISADFEEAVSRGAPERRLQALWHTTDFLIAGSYSEEQIWLFGEIIDRLAKEIEHGARVRLADILALSNNAPFVVVRKLASDDSIDVARPLLQHSDRIDTNTLIACSKTKGQQHLLAISQRKMIPVSVTDILVVRGSKQVVTSVANNSGAHFSHTGFLHLVRRSEGDSILAESLGLRKDIPRLIFHQLISRASEEVRRKLASERPDMERRIQSIVSDVAGTLHTRFGPASKDYFVARRTVTRLHQQGEVSEDKVFEFAHSLKFNETVVALSLLCSISIDIVERALVDRNRERILILAKGLGFSWTTAMSLLFLGAPDYQIIAGDLDELRVDFFKLNVETCLRVLAIYRSGNQGAVHDLRNRNLQT